jgi:hypothetical protein
MKGWNRRKQEYLMVQSFARAADLCQELQKFAQRSCCVAGTPFGIGA